MTSREKFAVFFAYLIAALWTISFFCDLLIPRYDPPAAIHALAMAVSGAFLAPEALRGLKIEKRD